MLLAACCCCSRRPLSCGGGAVIGCGHCCVETEVMSSGRHARRSTPLGRSPLGNIQREHPARGQRRQSNARYKGARSQPHTHSLAPPWPGSSASRVGFLQTRPNNATTGLDMPSQTGPNARFTDQGPCPMMQCTHRDDPEQPSIGRGACGASIEAAGATNAHGSPRHPPLLAVVPTSPHMLTWPRSTSRAAAQTKGQRSAPACLGSRPVDRLGALCRMDAASEFLKSPC